MRCISLNGYFWSLEAAPGVHLISTTKMEEYYFGAKFELCESAPNFRGTTVSSFILKAKGTQLFRSIHILIKLQVWYSALSFNSGKEAEQELIIFHIVTKVPFRTVQDKLSLNYLP